MSGFLYHLPETDRNVRLEDLAAAGLAYVFSEAPGERSFTPCPLTRGTGGPDGKFGVIIADSRTVARVGYYADEQTWLKMPAALVPDNPKSEIRDPKLIPWVGYFTADPPGPDDLVRQRVLPGHLVRMNDDREWLAPVARGWNDDEKKPHPYIALPTLTGIDDDGAWSAGGVAPKHEQLWDIALGFWDAMISELNTDAEVGNKIVFDFAGQNDAALAALQANYRIGKVEVALLGLFTDQCTGEVLQALIDGPTFKEWLKKKAAGSDELTAAG